MRKLSQPWRRKKKKKKTEEEGDSIEAKKNFGLMG
jgi:hypothetical protein